MRIHHVHRKRHVKCVTVFSANSNTVKPLNSGQLQVLKKLPVIKRCPLLGGSLTKIVTFGIKHFVGCSRHVRYLGCPLLGGFTVLLFLTILCIKCVKQKYCEAYSYYIHKAPTCLEK